MGNCFSSERGVPSGESSDHILQPFHQTQVTLHGDAGQVVTQHVHGVPVVQDVPIAAHRPLPDPLEAQLGKLCQASDIRCRMTRVFTRFFQIFGKEKVDLYHSLKGRVIL